MIGSPRTFPWQMSPSPDLVAGPESKRTRLGPLAVPAPRYAPSPIPESHPNCVLRPFRGSRVACTPSAADALCPTSSLPRSPLTTQQIGWTSSSKNLLLHGTRSRARYRAPGNSRAALHDLASNPHDQLQGHFLMDGRLAAPGHWSISVTFFGTNL